MIELPDFVDLMSRIETIGSLSELKERLEVDIMIREADTVRSVISNPDYFIGGKPPPMSFIESTFKKTGINGEITSLRYELATISARLEVARKSFDLLKSKIEVWRTMQATERSLT